MYHIPNLFLNAPACKMFVPTGRSQLLLATGNLLTVVHCPFAVKHCREFHSPTGACTRRYFLLTYNNLFFIICCMKTMQISDIDKMLTKLPEKKLKAVRKYIEHLVEKEKKTQNIRKEGA